MGGLLGGIFVATGLIAISIAMLVRRFHQQRQRTRRQQAEESRNHNPIFSITQFTGSHVADDDHSDGNDNDTESGGPIRFNIAPNASSSSSATPTRRVVLDAPTGRWISMTSHQPLKELYQWAQRTSHIISSKLTMPNFPPPPPPVQLSSNNPQFMMTSEEQAEVDLPFPTTTTPTTAQVAQLDNLPPPPPPGMISRPPGL
jgi:hypothetical protein